MDHEGKVALVTGGTRGIGLAIAEELIARGHRVVITSRSADSAKEVADRIGATGYGAHAGDEAAAKACVEAVVARFGALDVLVNNAGTNPAYGRLVDMTHDRVAKTFDTNVWAPLLWTSLAWHTTMRENGGVVINNASIGAFMVGPDIAVYHASKAALVHLTRHLAYELAPIVRVNAIAPGLIKTRMSQALWENGEEDVLASTPMGRLGMPADVAKAVAFLASDDSDWITGETLTVDGGQLLGPALVRPDA